MANPTNGMPGGTSVRRVRVCMRECVCAAGEPPVSALNQAKIDDQSLMQQAYMHNVMGTLTTTDDMGTGANTRGVPCAHACVCVCGRGGKGAFAAAAAAESW
jgi:hypothetical protein